MRPERFCDAKLTSQFPNSFPDLCEFVSGRSELHEVVVLAEQPVSTVTAFIESGSEEAGVLAFELFKPVLQFVLP